MTSNFLPLHVVNPSHLYNDFHLSLQELVESDEEEDFPQRRPAPALKTQVSDDGTTLKVKGANGAGPSSAPPTSQRPPSPAPIRPPPPVIAPPPLPPENVMKGLDIDGIKLGEAACLVDDVSPWYSSSHVFTNFESTNLPKKISLNFLCFVFLLSRQNSK